MSKNVEAESVLFTVETCGNRAFNMFKCTVYQKEAYQK